MPGRDQVLKSSGKLFFEAKKMPRETTRNGLFNIKGLETAKKTSLNKLGENIRVSNESIMKQYQMKIEKIACHVSSR